MKRYRLVYSGLLLCVSFVFADDNHTAMMDHRHNMGSSDKVLAEAGNDAFGTIQEVIQKLNSDPNTDWKSVNLEALRQHLIDMNDMTLNVEVVSQKPIPNGLKVIVKPATHRASLALRRVFQAHPSQLKKETGWDMFVVKDGDNYILTTTSKKPGETDKIRGLGYIGWMAYGAHHQPHHWGMATGENPHVMHHKMKQIGE